MGKYYYFDNNGNKKKYEGQIIKDLATKSTYGIITKYDLLTQKVDLDYHESTPEQFGWSSYFSYIDSQTKQELKYTDNINDIRKGINNSYFITKVINNEIELKHHNKIPGQLAYFTYIDNNGNETIYTGKTLYDKVKNTYFFYYRN